MSSGFHSRPPMRRRQDRERLLFLASAGLAFSLLIIMLVVLNYQSDASAGNKASNPENFLAPSSVTLFVPESAAKAGSRMNDIVLKEVNWPAGQVPDGAIRDRTEVRDHFAKMDLEPGVPLKRSFLTRNAMVNSLPVTPGNRAVTIDIDQTSGIEGLALPGTRVDIVLTYYEAGELTSKIIVQNARVLALGGDTKSMPDRTSLERRASQTARTVTLDVSAQDALKISTARQLGKISMIMRSAVDNEAPAVMQVNQGEVGDQETRKAREAASSKCNKGTVRVGGQEYKVDCDNRLIPLETVQ